MAAGALPWKWCCRLGTRDARGKDALKDVSAGAECHGHARYKKKRQWSITSEKNLDAFFAAEAVALLTGVNPEDADPEAVAAALKAAVAPVFRVDTARVCKPCWKAALSARLAGAIATEKSKLSFHAEENEPPVQPSAGQPSAGAGGALPTTGTAGSKRDAATPLAGAASPKKSKETPATSPPIISPAAAAATPAAQLRTQHEEELAVKDKALSDMRRNRDSWKGQTMAAREEQAKLRQANEELAEADRKAQMELTELRRELRRAKDATGVAERKAEKVERKATADIAAAAAALPDAAARQNRRSQGQETSTRRDGEPEECTLDGITVSLEGPGNCGHEWVLGRYRDCLFELHETYRVSMEKCLGCLLMVLRCTGLTVHCSTEDSHGLLTQIAAETAEICKQQLALELAAAIDPEFNPPAVEPPTYEEQPRMERPRADAGPSSDTCSSYAQEVTAKFAKWTEDGQVNGELVSLDAAFSAPVRTLEEVMASHRHLIDASKDADADAVRQQLQQILKMPATFAFHQDDTTKWNLRKCSAGLLSGPGFTEAGLPKLFFLFEEFGVGGSTGDCTATFDKFVEMRARQTAAGVPLEKQMFLYYCLSFCFDNCGSMKGRLQGLKIKLEQVRARKRSQSFSLFRACLGKSLTQ